jgi:hypothetical protein
MALILSRLSGKKIRGLASLRKARRNNSMKKTATPQTLANANNLITARLRARQGPGSKEKVKLTELNEMERSETYLAGA